MDPHAERILAAVEAGDASPMVASWRRCMTLYGLDPARIHSPERDSAALRECLDRDGRMIAVAKGIIDVLFKMFADAECGVYLADRDGMVLCMRTNGSVDSWGRRPEDVCGTVYSERTLGTCGVGTCLAEERAVLIRGPEHFIAQFVPLTCIGAPLFGPDGDRAGCLVIAQKADGYDPRLDAFLSLAVAGFARRIETEMFALGFPREKLVMASAAGCLPSALLAVDSDNCVVGATRAARRMLALPDRGIVEAVSFDELMERQAPDEDLRGKPTLRTAERRAMERALARCEGNMSAAAKLMGISRSTLYRKLALHELPRRHRRGIPAREENAPHR